VPTLRIDLQDGFELEPVTIRVNGEAVLTRSDVRTSRLTGFATSVAVDVPPGHVEIDVDVTSRHLHRRIVLEVSSDTFVGVSKTGSGLEYIERKEPFGYA
jgi:hypothetical protein